MQLVEDVKDEANRRELISYMNPLSATERRPTATLSWNHRWQGGGDERNSRPWKAAASKNGMNEDEARKKRSTAVYSPALDAALVTPALTSFSSCSPSLNISRFNNGARKRRPPQTFTQRHTHALPDKLKHIMHTLFKANPNLVQLRRQTQTLLWLDRVRPFLS